MCHGRRTTVGARPDGRRRPGESPKVPSSSPREGPTGAGVPGRGPIAHRRMPAERSPGSFLDAAERAASRRRTLPPTGLGREKQALRTPPRRRPQAPSGCGAASSGVAQPRFAASGQRPRRGCRPTSGPLPKRPLGRAGPQLQNGRPRSILRTGPALRRWRVRGGPLRGTTPQAHRRRDARPWDLGSSRSGPPAPGRSSQQPGSPSPASRSSRPSRPSRTTCRSSRARLRWSASTSCPPACRSRPRCEARSPWERRRRHRSDSFRRSTRSRFPSAPTPACRPSGAA